MAGRRFGIGGAATGSGFMICRSDGAADVSFFDEVSDTATTSSFATMRGAVAGRGRGIGSSSMNTVGTVCDACDAADESCSGALATVCGGGTACGAAD